MRKIVKYIEESNVVMVRRLLLGKKFVNLLGSAAITNIWAIIVNPMKFVDRLEGSDTHSPLLHPGTCLRVSSRQLLADYQTHKKLHQSFKHLALNPFSSQLPDQGGKQLWIDFCEKCSRIRVKRTSCPFHGSLT